MQTTIVSITSQGQVTIPKLMRESLKIMGATKAIIIQDGDTIIVKPKSGFWSLAGSLQSKIRLSNKQLKQARQEFSESWGKKP